MKLAGAFLSVSPFLPLFLHARRISAPRQSRRGHYEASIESLVEVFVSHSLGFLGFSLPLSFHEPCF